MLQQTKYSGRFAPLDRAFCFPSSSLEPFALGYIDINSSYASPVCVRACVCVCVCGCACVRACVGVKIASHASR